MNRMKNFTAGFVRENPVFSLYLGICSTLAVSTTLNNAIGMSVAVIVVLVLSNMIISAIRNITPNEIRIPVYIVIIAALVKIIQMLITAYAPALDTALGTFIPLIVVNCIILGRAEAFASKHPVLDSAIDGIATGLGLTFALTFIGIIREFLGSGSFFGIQVMDFKIGFFTNSAGAFFVYGICIALFVLVTNKMEQARRVKKMRTLRMPAGDGPLPPVSETTKEGN